MTDISIPVMKLNEMHFKSINRLLGVNMIGCEKLMIKSASCSLKHLY